MTAPLAQQSPAIARDALRAFLVCSYHAQVRITREELIWKALLAIDKLYERALRGEQIPKSLLLRFSLAFTLASSLAQKEAPSPRRPSAAQQ